MKYMEKIEQLQNCEEFMQKMAMVNSLEELQELFSEYGVELTMEELNAMMASADVGAYGEMSENDLDNVSGGGFFSWLYEKLKNKNTRDVGRLSGLY